MLDFKPAQVTVFSLERLAAVQIACKSAEKLA
jgi:hypothetical protein